VMQRDGSGIVRSVPALLLVDGVMTEAEGSTRLRERIDVPP
ncbi:MAG: hypothetical protein QG661_2781, partial [Actinomycetota bacterium]|nr:hypothetical protein [Actinomycetota bacterium]